MSQNYEYFGKYILLEKLATGGMAEVFLARAPGAGGIAKFVAIKRILPQFSDNKEFIDMFRDEAKIAVNLSHSNVVSIFEFGVEQNQFFLVMDYVEGRNLRQILNKMKKARSKFSIEQIVFIIKEVAAGLDHAHRCLDGTTGRPLNITHRDMSPQNVMMSFEGEIKIVDFGIAKAETQVESTRTGTLKGKFGYMSPEQADGQPVDLRTDIFSLGTVLWELLANDRLFIANNEINTLRKIRECQIPSLRKINPNIHAELERICMKALARDRNLRYQTAAAFQRDLNRFLNRQYPDFSPQDLGVFIKSLYADEILETRKRIVQYAQIPFRDGSTEKAQEKASVHSYQPNDDKTMVTDSEDVLYIDGTLTRTEPDSLASTKSATVTDPNLNLTELSAKVSHISKSNIDNTPSASSLKVQPPPKASSKPHIDPKSLNLSRNAGSDEALSLADNTPTTHGPRPSDTRIRNRDVRIHSSPFRPVLYLGALLVCSYIVLDILAPKELEPYLKLVRRWINPKSGLMGQQELPSRQGHNPTAPQTPQAPTPAPANTMDRTPPPVESVAETMPVVDNVINTSIVINSDPSGAEIYISGKSTGKTTPARVEVPANRPFEVHLKKERYIDYHVPNFMVADLQGKAFNATLQRAMIGYVDIDVKPPHQVRIYINGQRLAEDQLPVTRYAIPAGSPVRIRAENPVTGAKAETTVNLRQDERKSVVLSLKTNDIAPRERRPSGN